MRITNYLGTILMVVLATASAATYAQEQHEITIAKLPGIMFLPTIVMEKQGLVEKAAAKLGVKDLKVNWHGFSGGGAATDALLSGSVQVLNSGVGNMLLLWDRTKGNVKAIVANAAVPQELVTNNPRIKTLRDYGPKDRIAVPTIGVSTGALLLQMASEEEFGKDQWSRLNANMVQMGHPEALALMANPRSEVGSDFSGPPFFYLQKKNIPGAHTVLRSGDIVKGGLTQLVLYTTTKFADANPKIIQAVTMASEESVAYIKANTEKSVGIYREITGDKTSVAELMDMLKQPGMMDYGIVPVGTMKLAEHMHKVGILKTMPKKWTDYFLPASAGLNGN